MQEEARVGDRVGKMVSRYIGDLEDKAEKRASKPVTFSMRLSAKEHARLVWLAENLHVSKTPFAEELLKAALEEASPEDPEAFLDGALEGIEDRLPEKKARGKRPPRPGHRKPKP
jgi:hypothetical protein